MKPSRVSRCVLFVVHMYRFRSSCLYETLFRHSSVLLHSCAVPERGGGWAVMNNFSLHYCYVKITIFHPVVSKIKLRFYLKPGNREPMFECWDESGSEHPDSAGRSLSFPQPTRSWATGQPISTLYSFTDCESQGYS